MYRSTVGLWNFTRKMDDVMKRSLFTIISLRSTLEMHENTIQTLRVSIYVRWISMLPLQLQSKRLHTAPGIQRGINYWRELISSEVILKGRLIASSRRCVCAPNPPKFAPNLQMCISRRAIIGRQSNNIGGAGI